MEKAEKKSLFDRLKRKKADETPIPPAEPPLCVIRPFDKKDYCTLSLLMNGFKQAVGEEPLTQLEWASLRTGIEADCITYYIAWQGERAVGMYSLCRGFSSFKCAPCGIFEDFYVLPEERGTGVARMLAEHAADTVRSWSGRTLTVSCAACDREMYGALGFADEIGITLSRLL